MEEINKLGSNLADAEETQIQQRSLERLKSVCYDMEDVLDEWVTALFKSQIDVDWNS